MKNEECWNCLCVLRKSADWTRWPLAPARPIALLGKHIKTISTVLILHVPIEKVVLGCIGNDNSGVPLPSPSSASSPSATPSRRASTCANRGFVQRSLAYSLVPFWSISTATLLQRYHRRILKGKKFILILEKHSIVISGKKFILILEKHSIVISDLTAKFRIKAQLRLAGLWR